MKTTAKHPINWEEKYKETVPVLEKENAELKALIAYYEGKLRLAAARRFGASSEKTHDPMQLSLDGFNEVEAIAEVTLPEPELEEITYKRKKQKGKRAEDLSGLEVEIIEHDLDERDCPECGNPLHFIANNKRNHIKIIPAKAVVEEHRQAVYGCRHCEKNATGSGEATIIKAPMPEPVIKGSLASPSSVAHIMSQKYVMYLPLYRQEQEWKRQGVILSRQTMANWVIRCANDWLLPIYSRLYFELKLREVFHADETSLQVIKELGREAKTKSYMWLYRTSGDTNRHIVLYEYTETRQDDHPQKFLEGFTGWLHTDGYAAYHNLPGLTVVGCWAHMRRYFEDALKAMPKTERPESLAKIGEAYCNKLFELERKYDERKLTPDERHTARDEKSVPVAEAFFAWAAKSAETVLPKSPAGAVFTYAANQREWLMNVFLDGRLELSNNRAERSIKPFVMGRKNFLFSYAPSGAHASAIVYSIIETAKENNLRPFEYLEYLFQTLPNCTTSAIDSLLPWSDSLPEHCKRPFPKSKK
jgi:transposase